MKYANFPLNVLLGGLLVAGIVFVPFVTSATADISAGLVGHWSFNEGSGTVADDSSGNGNTGTIKNSPVWAAGKIGGALQFDGVDDHISIAHNAVLNSDSATISLWFKPNGVTNDVTLLNKQSGYWIRVLSNRVYFYVWNGSAWKGRSFGSGLQDGAWQHLVVTHSDQTLRVYLNKQELSSSPYTMDSPASFAAHPLYIGAYFGTSRFFNGAIDDVRMYNRVIDASEIEELYNVATPPALSGGIPSGTLPSGTTETTVSVTTNKVADCKYASDGGVEYASMPDMFSVTGDTSHSFIATGLEAGAQYTYYIKCLDSFGNVSAQDYTVSFAVASAIPPSVPTSLELVPLFANPQINLRWGASTNTGGTITYRIYRDGAKIAETAQTTYQDTTVMPSTTYSYAVSAYSGTESQKSTAVSTQTHPPFSLASPPDYFPFGAYVYVSAGNFNNRVDDAGFAQEIAVHADAMKSKGINVAIFGGIQNNTQLTKVADIFYERGIKSVGFGHTKYLYERDINSEAFADEYDTKAATVNSQVPQWVNNPKIAGWYPVEEYDTTAIEGVRQFASLFQAADPSHPIITEHNNVDSFKVESPTIADVLIVGTYPFRYLFNGTIPSPNEDMKYYTEHRLIPMTNLIKEKDKKPVLWALIQGSPNKSEFNPTDKQVVDTEAKIGRNKMIEQGWEWSEADQTWSMWSRYFPTPYGTRGMMWTATALGVKGLMTWSYSGYYDLSANTHRPHWSELQQTISEIAPFTKLLLNLEMVDNNTPQSPDPYVLLRTHRDKLKNLSFVVVVNQKIAEDVDKTTYKINSQGYLEGSPLASSRTITVSSVQGQKVYDLKTKQEIPLSNSTFQVTLQPGEGRIFLVGGSNDYATYVSTYVPVSTSGSGSTNSATNNASQSSTAAGSGSAGIIYGCIDSQAKNFMAIATIDNGECEYDPNVATRVASTTSSTSLPASGMSSSKDTTNGSLMIPVESTFFEGSLRRGVRGSEVVRLQNFLIARGHLEEGKNTGFYGSLTETAVQRFQEEHHIATTGMAGYGVFGPKTRAKANEILPVSSDTSVNTTPTSSSGTEFTRNLTVGSRGEDVRRLQIFLNTNGFPIAATGGGSPGNETTFFGALTKQALIRYQNIYKDVILVPIGLSEGTGVFGPATITHVRQRLEAQ